jgi:hypothetical protein
MNSVVRPQVFDDFGATERVLSMIRNAQLSGDTRAIPEQLFGLIGKVIVQPAVEMIIIDRDKGCYIMQRRPENESSAWGAGLLHIPGGFLKPVPGPASVLSTAQWMAAEELGIHSLNYIAGPLAVYRWPMEAHEYANPISLLYVFEAQGIRTEGEGVVEFSLGDIPERSSLIKGHGGDVHYKLLRVFTAAHDKDFNVPCIDLNMD